MPQFQADFGVLSELVRGVVVAAILLPIAFTSLAAGSISDRISRKRTISLGCATFSLGSAISCGSNSLPMLILGRCIAGAGQVRRRLHLALVGEWSAYPGSRDSSCRL